jgi:hypothetical protein
MVGILKYVTVRLGTSLLKGGYQQLKSVREACAKRTMFLKNVGGTQRSRR